MTKQMNEYVLLFKSADAVPLPDVPAAAFSDELSQWVRRNGASDDVLRTEAAPTAGVRMVCTDNLARRIADAFGAVASLRMDKENVITFPDPLPKKTRRPDATPQ